MSLTSALAQLYPVKPTDSSQWPIYLRHYLPYIEESWPENLNNGNDAYLTSLDKLLRQRHDAGGRYFFFVRHEGRDVGIVNVYETENTFGIPLSDGNNLVLNIAEFYVMPNARRKGFGGDILAQIMQLAHDLGLSAIIAEADKHLERANAFWRAQMDGALDLNGRNVYWKELWNSNR